MIVKYVLYLFSHNGEFYKTRKDIITKRLEEIRSDNDNGQFIEQMITETYSRECENQTMAIGISFNGMDNNRSLQWRYSLDEIAYLARFLKPRGVYAVCERFSREYVKCQSGMPDLCLLHLDRGTCKFVEVKSENDVLSSKQKIWIHLLVGAGVQVEICHVLPDTKKSR